MKKIIIGVCAVMLGIAAQAIPQVEGEAGQQEEALDAAQSILATGIDAQCAERHDEERYDDVERDVATDVRPRVLDGHHQGGDTEDEEDVEDVRPHHIANGNLGMSPEARHDTHHQLGHAGAHAYDGGSDDIL